MKNYGLLVLCFLATACAGGSETQGGQDLAETQSAAVSVRDTLSFSSAALQEECSDTVEMGRIRAGEVVSETFMIRNDDVTPFVVLSVKSNCGCTQVEYPRTPIAPGKSAPFSFEFNSTGFNGFQVKHITISTSLSNRSYTLVATAEVI